MSALTVGLRSFLAVPARGNRTVLPQVLPRTGFDQEKARPKGDRFILVSPRFKDGSTIVQARTLHLKSRIGKPVCGFDPRLGH